MKKLRIIIVIVLVAAFPVIRIVKTEMLRANVDIGSVQSTIFEEEEIFDAIKVVKKSFSSYNTKRIDRIWYDEAWSKECIYYRNQEGPEKYDLNNTIVLLCDFETNGRDYVWPNTKRTDIEFLLIRSESGDRWIIIDAGVA